MLLDFLTLKYQCLYSLEYVTDFTLHCFNFHTQTITTNITNRIKPGV